MIITLVITGIALRMAGFQMWIVTVSAATTILIAGLIFYLVIFRKRPIEKLDWLVRVENGNITLNDKQDQISINLQSLSQVVVKKTYNGEIVRIDLIGSGKNSISYFTEDLQSIVNELSEFIDESKIEYSEISRFAVWISGALTAAAVALLYWLRITSYSAILRIVLEPLLPIGGGIFLLVLPYGQNPFLRRKRKNVLAILLITFFSAEMVFELHSHLQERRVEIDSNLTIVFPEVPERKSNEHENVTLETYFSSHKENRYVADILTFKRSLTHEEMEEVISEFVENYTSQNVYSVREFQIDNGEYRYLLSIADQTYMALVIDALSDSVILIRRAESSSEMKLKRRWVRKYMEPYIFD